MSPYDAWLERPYQDWWAEDEEEARESEREELGELEWKTERIEREEP